MKVPILVPNIFDHPFTYESGGIDIKLGDYVSIPFGKSIEGLPLGVQLLSKHFNEQEIFNASYYLENSKDE